MTSMRPTGFAWSMVVSFPIAANPIPPSNPRQRGDPMQKPQYRSALIVGTGPGLSASLARLFAREGLAVAVAAGQTDKLGGLAKETGAEVDACNAAEPAAVAELFAKLDAAGRTPDVVVYNASNRTRGPLIDLAPDDQRPARTIARVVDHDVRRAT